MKLGQSTRELGAWASSDSYERWVAATHEYVATVGSYDAFLERRHEFLSSLAREATMVGPGRRVASKYIVYGVYLPGHECPAYVGQSCTGRSRLRNLVFGEGHHLATSTPPEVWERIVVIDWLRGLPRDLIASAAEEAARVLGVRRHLYSLIGLSLENMLQCELLPPLNLRRKLSDGSYLRIEKPVPSQRIRKLRPHLEELYSELAERWDELANFEPNNSVSEARSWGRVVFPNAAFRRRMAKA